MGIKATHYEAAFCDNPECGLHLLIYDGDTLLSEVVMGKEKTLGLMEFCKDQLYARTVLNDKGV